MESSLSSLIAFQFFNRFTTFFLNNAIIRLTSPITLGISSIRLDLYINTCLFLARDGLRMALLRFPSDNDNNNGNQENVNGKDNPGGKLSISLRGEKGKMEGEKRLLSEWIRKFVNMSWLSLPLGIFFIILFGIINVIQQRGNGEENKAFLFAVVMYGLAALIELLTEPFSAFFFHNQNYKLRISVESIALTIRTFVILGMVLILKYVFEIKDDSKIGLYAFPIGQIFHSIALMIAFFATFWRHEEFKDITWINLLPHWPFIMDKATVGLAWEMSKQLLLKYFISQGDMWIIGLFSDISNQGLYAVAANYGSLICRIILQPMEESSLLYFSKTLAGYTRTRLIQSTDAMQMQPSDNIKMAIQYLELILKLDVLISMFFTCFAPFYTKILIGILLGSNWNDLSPILSFYCLFIPFLVFNGILEAFMHSTISKKWIKITNNGTIAYTLIYILSAIPLVKRFNSIGLIMANMINFGLRTMHATIYFWQFLANTRMEITNNILLSNGTNFAFLASAYLSFKSFQYFDDGTHFLIGIVIFFLLALIVMRNERQLFDGLYQTFVKSKKKNV